MIIAFAAFVVGACLGSFLNVVIIRLPDPKQSICYPRSHCPCCQTPLNWYDLIPIISWFLLRGRCRFCRAPISRRYPLIEFILGSFAFALFLKFGLSLKAFELFVMIATLVAVAFIDLDTWLIPLSLPIFLVLSGLVFGFVGNEVGDSGNLMPLVGGRALGAVLGFLFFSAFLVVSTWLLRRSGRLSPDELAMGWGDPFLLGGIGAYVGLLHLPYVILLASLQGIAAYLLLGPMSSKSSDGWQPPQRAMPFGPFLSLAAIEVALFWPSISRLGQQFAIFFRT